MAQAVKAPNQARKLAPARFHTVIESERLLIQPIGLAIDEDRLVAYDFGDRSVKCFSLGGEFRWRFGRRGGAPGEFQTPTDIKLDSRGNTWIADPPAGRITIIAPSGQLLRTISVGSQIKTILPGDDGSFIGQDDSSPWLSRFSSDGSRIGPFTVPQFLQGRDWVQGELWMDGRTTAVVALRWSGSWFSLAPSTSPPSQRQFDGLERIQIPEWRIRSRTIKGRTIMTKSVDPLAAEGAIGLAVRGNSEALVLFGGVSPNSRRIIDTFEPQSGRYLRSILLPATVQAIAANRSVILAIAEEPTQHIVRIVEQP